MPSGPSLNLRDPRWRHVLGEPGGEVLDQRIRRGEAGSEGHALSPDPAFDDDLAGLEELDVDSRAEGLPLVFKTVHDDLGLREALAFPYQLLDAVEHDGSLALEGVP